MTPDFFPSCGDRSLPLHCPVAHVTHSVVTKTCTGKSIGSVNTGEGRLWMPSTIPDPFSFGPIFFCLESTDERAVSSTFIRCTRETTAQERPRCGGGNRRKPAVLADIPGIVPAEVEPGPHRRLRTLLDAGGVHRGDTMLARHASEVPSWSPAGDGGPRAGGRGIWMLSNRVALAMAATSDQRNEKQQGNGLCQYV